MLMRKKLHVALKEENTIHGEQAFIRLSLLF